MDFVAIYVFLFCFVIALGYMSNKDLFSSEQKKKLNLIIYYYFLMYMSILPARMSVYHEHNWLEESIRSLELQL